MPAIVLCLILIGVLPPAGRAQSIGIIADSTADSVDTNPGDGQCRTASGQCTLRAAIQEANALPGANTINVPAGIYELAIVGGDDMAANGDLDITGDTTIVGAGRTATVIDGKAINRVFEIWNSAPQATLSRITIRGGKARPGQSGGGILNHGQATLEDVAVSGNAAPSGGGIASLRSMVLNSVVVTGNSTDSFSGGGIYNQGALTVNGSLVSENTASEEGGGISNLSGGSLILNGSTVRQNSTVDGSGGGIHNSGNATLIGSSVSNNTSSTLDGGGGINNAGGRLSVTGSTISGNSTNGLGGAILNRGGDVTATNSTISDNSATDAGGVYNDGGSLISANSTFSSNVSPSAGGIINIAGTVALRNTILAANNGSAPDCSGSIASQGYNLIGSPSGCTWVATTGDQIGSVASPIDPKLGPLQDNGGTTLTRAPLTGSPAIDAGNPATPGSETTACTTTDQVGASRPQGARCDIGAIEVFPIGAPPVLSSLTPPSAKASGAGFTLTVQGANFTNGATVHWNGTARPTSFVSSSQLTATISSGDIKRAGTASVTVVNPSPMAGESDARSFIITASPAYMPLLTRTLPPRCDSFEPNDDRRVNPSGPLVSGTLYRARICADDVEDNYYFDAQAASSAQIALSIPPRLVGHFAIGIYAQSALALPLPILGCYTNPVTSRQFSRACPLPGAGRYIVRLYGTEGAYDDTNDYVLQVSYQ